MKELVLIDGNSLLNRAFYATKLLSTKDGTPTNAVFGFVKLLLKIISDNNPDKLIVTFDLKAPTFRHKMYDGYKATRKPMPDDLAAQVGILKSLLKSMEICMCEKEGYEADDLIGTLSHAFADTHSIIITGDRDSYQLVDERTDVYITKKGVSELLKLNEKNFESEIGYPPARVVDMKALMGDSSDNIPGVPGIGEKTAFSLVTQFGSLDNVYAHLDDISSSVRAKLESGKESAYLSRTLATIDRNVPLNLSEEEGEIRMPFSAEVRDQFLKLEFTSLLKLDIFAEDTKSAEPICQVEVCQKEIADVRAFLSAFNPSRFAAVSMRDGSYHFYADGTEYILHPARTLLDAGVSPEETASLLRELFARKGVTVLLYGKKNFRHILRKEGAQLLCDAEDVSLMRYLAEPSGKNQELDEALREKGIDDAFPAAGLYSLYEKLKEKAEKDGLVSLYRDVELFPMSYTTWNAKASVSTLPRLPALKSGTAKKSPASRRTSTCRRGRHSISIPRCSWAKFCLKSCACPPPKRERTPPARISWKNLRRSIRSFGTSSHADIFKNFSPPTSTGSNLLSTLRRGLSTRPLIRR